MVFLNIYLIIIYVPVNNKKKKITRDLCSLGLSAGNFTEPQ